MVSCITSMERVGVLSDDSVFRMMGADQADKYCPLLMRSRRYNVCRLLLQKM